MEINEIIASRTKRFWAFAIDQTVITIGVFAIFLAVFATQADQIANFINVVFGDPVWSQINTLPQSEANKRVEALFSSDAVIAASQALAYPFAFAMVFSLLFEAIYYIVPTVRYGATLGKRLLHITVHSIKENTLPSWEQSSIRYFVFLGLGTFGGIVSILDLFVNRAFLPSNAFVDVLGSMLSQITLIVSIIAVAMIIARPDRRGFHDILAKTIVHDTSKRNQE